MHFSAALTFQPPVYAPTGLVATGGSSIGLAWNVSASGNYNSTGFSIERSIDGVTGWTQIGRVGVGVRVFNDASPLNGTNYYRVREVNSAGAGPYSAVVSAATLTAGTLSVTAHDAASVSLSWTAATGGNLPLTYQPQYRVVGDVPWLSFLAPISGLAEVVTGLVASTSYEFRVVVADSAAQTAATNTSAQATAASLLQFAFSAFDSALFTDTAGTAPSTVAGGNVKAANGASGTTPTFQWQSGGVPILLAGGRAGGPAAYMDSAELKVINSPTLWVSDFVLTFTVTPRDDVGGTVKQLFRKAAVATDPWIFRLQTKRPELVGLTGNVPPSVWDMDPVVPRGPQTIVFEWQASNTTLYIYVNSLRAAAVVGAKPALDVVNDYYLGGGLGGNNATTEFMDARALSGLWGQGGVRNHTFAMQRTHFLGQCHLVIGGDSLSADTRAGWVLAVATSLVTAGIHRPIVNCGKGGQAITAFASNPGNSLVEQYPAREKGLIPDPSQNGVYVVQEAVNQLFLLWQAAGGGAPGSYDPAALAASCIEAERLFITQARADGYKVIVGCDMYDVTPTYVPLDIKHAYNSQKAALFPTSHPRVTNVKLPAAGAYYGDFMLAWSALANLGPDGSSDNLTYFTADKIHEGPSAGAIKAVPAVALITDWQTNPPAAFSIPAAQAAADITTGVIAKYLFDGNANDSGGAGLDLTVNGPISYQAGLINQEAVLAGATYLSHASVAALKLNTYAGWEICHELTPNAFTSPQFWGRIDTEWDIISTAGTGRVLFRAYNAAGATIGTVDIAATWGLVTVKRQYVSYGIDIANNVIYVCLDGALSYAPLTGVPKSNSGNPLQLFGTGLAGQYSNVQVGAITIYGLAPLITTPANYALARSREMAIRTGFGLGAL